MTSLLPKAEEIAGGGLATTGVSAISDQDDKKRRYKLLI
tara:strand:- start:364 stop:480 length:117 start_codon:yes stop_codon:yes gene_type:complete